MKETELRKLIKKGESQGLEFKSTPEAIGKSLCAFSNTNYGVILVGVADDGAIQGVSDRHEATIANVAHSCKPAVYPEIEKVGVKGKTVFVARVCKSDHIHSFGNIAYKRVGTHNKPLSPDEVIEFAKEIGKFHFDSQICRDASLDDIDWDFVKAFFIPRYEQISKSPVSSTPKELLVALGCIRSNKPTNAGILLFGKKPQNFLMNTYVALARYKGEVESPERLDYREFNGNLFKQIDDADLYIKEHVAVMSRLLPHRVEREDIPEYGWFTVRELVTNAVCHRDYSEPGSKVIIKMFDNRIEYYNPGGLPPNITPKNIIAKQFSRNPVIANVFSKIKYIEELGEGWNKIYDEYKVHPLKPALPKINADAASFLVNIFSTKDKFQSGKLELNARQKAAISYLRIHDRMTNSIYQEINHTTKKTASRDLKDLLSAGFIMKKGTTGKGVYYILVSPLKGDIRGHELKGDIRGHKGT